MRREFRSNYQTGVQSPFPTQEPKRSLECVSGASRGIEQPSITSDLGPFGVVQRRVAGRVTCSSFAVYALLCTYADRNSMTCFPSVKTLCKQLAMKDTTMRRALKELETKGIITINRNPLADGQYLSNTYHIHVIGEQDPSPISGGTLSHSSSTNYTSEHTMNTKLDVKGNADGSGEKNQQGNPRFSSSNDGSPSLEQKLHWGYSLENWVQRATELALDPKKTAKGYELLCPCHTDSKHSLSIATGKSRSVVAKCHAGCQFEDICQFMFGGKFSQPSVYTYANEQDRPLYRIVRGKGKQFHVETLLGDGTWSKQRPDTTVPYRLPKLLQAITKGLPVYVVEGEKDVHTAEQKGLTATCNPFGAGSWEDSLSPYFSNAKVIIVADRDKAGRKHAQEVKRSLEPYAKSVTVKEPYTGKDLTDHLEHWGINMLTAA